MSKIVSFILTSILFLGILSPSITYGAQEETCSRVAVVNYQEILVDTDSTQKGEGLRYYLEKDEVAKTYLNMYQENSKVGVSGAIIGTVGSSLILAGLLTNNEGDNKRSLLFGGASLILINFLMAKTFEYQNEDNLYRAIEEYNKRNLPRIYFKPAEENTSRNPSSTGIGVMKSWSF